MTGSAPRPLRCCNHRPGHVLHHIQVRLFFEDYLRRATGTGIVAGLEDGLIVVELGDRTVRLWNHDPGRVAAALGRCAPDAVLSRRLSTLALRERDGGWAVFSAAFPRGEAEDPPVTACTPCRRRGR